MVYAEAPRPSDLGRQIRKHVDRIPHDSIIASLISCISPVALSTIKPYEQLASVVLTLHSITACLLPIVLALACCGCRCRAINWKSISTHFSLLLLLLFTRARPRCASARFDGLFLLLLATVQMHKCSMVPRMAKMWHFFFNRLTRHVCTRETLAHQWENGNFFFLSKTESEQAREREMKRTSPTVSIERNETR